MSSLFGRLFAAIWLAWLAYWIVSARSVKPAQRRESVASRLAHVLPLLVAALLLGWGRVPPGWLSWLSGRWLPASVIWPSAGAAITVLGLALTVWARQGLGTNWSATVAVKQDHELVLTGPYRHVRHPIYGGLLLAFAGAALARGEWRGILALPIAWLALRRKWRLEERFMRETFGTAYSEYAARTPAVIPRLF
jgi:protein-S-isoprenylcysteine O-methyltransferase Ste14